MGLYDGVKNWLRDRNESKIKDLNKNGMISDFDLLYKDNLEKVCNAEEIERIKGKFIEWTELGNELRANELTPPSPEKTKRIIKLELFFNNLNKIVNSGRLNEELSTLEQDRASLSTRISAIELKKVKDKMELEKRAQVGRGKGEKGVNVLPKDRDERGR